MGMYTGLRFKGIVKPEFASMIKDMVVEGVEWDDLADAHPEHAFLQEYADYNRADFVPRGALAYMPDSWEEQPWTPASKATDGFDGSFNVTERLWSFQCSLKNYESTIEKFLEVIVPNMIEEAIHIEYYYEEWESSTFFDLKDGIVIESEREGINYL